MLGVRRGEWQMLRPTSGVSGLHRLRPTLRPGTMTATTRNNDNSLFDDLDPEQLLRQSGTTTRDSPRPRLVLAFCKAGLCPSLRLAPRPVLGSTFLRGASRKASKGGVPPPRPHHTAHPPIGRGRATPPPSHSVRRRGEEDSGGIYSSGSFGREI